MLLQMNYGTSQIIHEDHVVLKMVIIDVWLGKMMIMMELLHVAFPAMFFHIPHWYLLWNKWQIQIPRVSWVGRLTNGYEPGREPSGVPDE